MAETEALEDIINWAEFANDSDELKYAIDVCTKMLIRMKKEQADMDKEMDLAEMSADYTAPSDLHNKPVEGGLCNHCNDGFLKFINGVEPYNEDHLQCEKCDSTYCIDEDPDILLKQYIKAGLYGV